MIININNQERVNYDNVIHENIVERKNGALKVKFTFVNSEFMVLLMSEDQYDEFKQKTSNPSINQIINLNCSIVKLLKG
jgi:hypothetical protein